MSTASSSKGVSLSEIETQVTSEIQQGVELYEKETRAALQSLVEIRKHRATSLHTLGYLLIDTLASVLSVPVFRHLKDKSVLLDSSLKVVRSFLEKEFQDQLELPEAARLPEAEKVILDHVLSVSGLYLLDSLYETSRHKHPIKQEAVSIEKLAKGCCRAVKLKLVPRLESILDAADVVASGLVESGLTLVESYDEARKTLQKAAQQEQTRLASSLRQLEEQKHDLEKQLESSKKEKADLDSEIKTRKDTLQQENEQLKSQIRETASLSQREIRSREEAHRSRQAATASRSRSVPAAARRTAAATAQSPPVPSSFHDEELQITRL